MNLAGAASIFSLAGRAMEAKGGWRGVAGGEGGRRGLCNKYLSCDLCAQRREEGGLRREDEEGDNCALALTVCMCVRVCEREGVFV